MKQILTLLLVVYFSNSFGQFAIVADKDNFVNVRKDAAPNSKVIDELPNGQLIYCFAGKGNWTNIDYHKNGKDGNGYVYKDRYKMVSNFPSLRSLKKSVNKVTFKQDSIEVSVSQVKFDTKKHKFKYFRSNPNQIELIDKQRYWGTDGAMPTTQFSEISIKIGNKTMLIHTKAIAGLYQPNLDNVKVNYDKRNQIIYIQAMNSDGAGSYLVIWKVENGKYKDRLVAFGF